MSLEFFEIVAQRGDLRDQFGRDDVVRVARRLVHLRVEHNEQVQFFQSGARLDLIGPGGQWIAAQAEERTDLAVALEQDLVSKRTCWQTAGSVGEPANPQCGRKAPGNGHGFQRLGASRSLGYEHAGVRDPVTLLGTKAAERDQASQKILGQSSPRRHIGPGTGAGATGFGVGEDPRGLAQLIGRNVSAFLHELRCKWFDVLAQFFEILAVLGNEVLVLKPFCEHKTNHAGQDGRILAGNRLQVDSSLLCGFAASGINHDQFDSTLYRSVQVPVGIDRGDAAKARYRRVGADEQPCFRLGECSAARVPFSVQGACQEFSGLVDRAAAE